MSKAQAIEKVNRPGCWTNEQKRYLREILDVVYADQAAGTFDPSLLELDVGVFGESTNVRLSYDSNVESSFPVGDLLSVSAGNLVTLDGGLIGAFPTEVAATLISGDAGNDLTTGADDLLFVEVTI